MHERGDGRVFLRPGSAVYQMSFYLNGKEHRESTGKRDEQEAEKVLRNKLKEVHAAQIGALTLTTTAMKRVTVGDLLDDLKADFILRGKGSTQNLGGIKRAKDEFGDIRALAFGPNIVNKFIEEKLAEGYANAGINRLLEPVKQAFSLAVREDRLQKIPYIKRLSEAENVRQGFVTRDEFNRVHANLPDDLRDLCLFGFLTGWRRGEIRGLDWSNVQEDDSMIRLRPEQSKNRHGRSLPVHGELAAIIKRRRESRAVTLNGQTRISKFVFHRGNGERIGDFRKSWALACQAAGKPNLLFHDLRRSAVSALIAAKVPTLIAMTISGHKTQSMIARYNISAVDEQRAALLAVEQFHAKKVAEAEAQASNVVPMTQAAQA